MNTDEDYEDYLTDPEEMEEKYGHQVDMVIDGGIGGKTPSTLVNCVDEPFEIIREGAGVLKF